MRSSRIEAGWGRYAALGTLAVVVLLVGGRVGQADEHGPAAYGEMRQAIQEWIAEGGTTYPYPELPRIAVNLADKEATQITFAATGSGTASLFAHLSLSDEDPSRDLWQAALLIESFRRVAKQFAPAQPELAARLARAVRRSEDFVKKGLKEIRQDDQPPSAMQDRMHMMERRVINEFHDAIWFWAEENGRLLGSPDAEGREPQASPEIPSLEAIRTKARELARNARGSFLLSVRGSELEYRIAPFAPPGVLSRIEDGLVDALARAELVRIFAEEREAAGRAGVLAFWTPVVEYIEAYVARALEDLGSSRNQHEVLLNRVGVWNSRAVDAIHARLWSHAANASLVLWPLASDPEGQARPTTGGGEIALSVRRGTREEIIPARYETRVKKVCVRPATTSVEVIPARYEMRDGKLVMVEPERIREIPIPAVYETVEEQVCASPEICRKVQLPATWIKLRIHEDFGVAQHLWFLDAWTWKKFTKYHPNPTHLWDHSSPTPPEPWVDLLTDPGALAARRGSPMVKGWLVVVGSRGASGPARVTFGTEVGAPSVFSVCSRSFATAPAGND